MRETQREKESGLGSRRVEVDQAPPPSTPLPTPHPHPQLSIWVILEREGYFLTNVTYNVGHWGRITSIILGVCTALLATMTGREMVAMALANANTTGIVAVGNGTVNITGL